MSWYQEVLKWLSIFRMKKRINLILFGPPGSGKGTQAKILEEKFSLLQISTGDLFRYELGNNTPLGQKARAYMDQGQLVPDEVTVDMLRNKLEKHPDVRGYIFDGFPRTIAQAEALDGLLHERNESVNQLIALKVEDEEIIKRLLERGKSSGRADDANVEVIQERIKVYNAETSPVFEFYRQKDLALEVEGIGSIEEINNRLSEIIQAIL